jgi:hypothetical protein
MVDVGCKVLQENTTVENSSAVIPTIHGTCFRRFNIVAKLSGLRRLASFCRGLLKFRRDISYVALVLSFFYGEDGSMLLRNVGKCIAEFTAPHKKKGSCRNVQCLVCLKPNRISEISIYWYYGLVYKWLYRNLPQIFFSIFRPQNEVDFILCPFILSSIDIPLRVFHSLNNNMNCVT